MLYRVAAAGGRLTISGLSDREMLQQANRANHLKSKGLVRARIQFSQSAPGQPVAVELELTEQGRKWLDSRPSA